MFSRLKRKIFLWLSGSEEVNYLGSLSSKNSPRTLLQKRLSTMIDQPGTMSFTIHHAANGGYVLECSSREDNPGNFNSGNINPGLHIISAEENLGEAIAHIITLELLRR